MIVERYKKERELPILDKVKFLVPQEFTVSNFCVVVRSKLVIRPSQSLHFIVGNKAGMFSRKTYWLNPRKTYSTYVFSPINGYGSGWVIQSLQRRRWISLYHLCFNRDVWLTLKIATNHYKLLRALLLIDIALSYSQILKYILLNWKSVSFIALFHVTKGQCKIESIGSGKSIRSFVKCILILGRIRSYCSINRWNRYNTMTVYFHLESYVT